jgi:hypothetical protein
MHNHFILISILPETIGLERERLISVLIVVLKGLIKPWGLVHSSKEYWVYQVFAIYDSTLDRSLGILPLTARSVVVAMSRSVILPNTTILTTLGDISTSGWQLLMVWMNWRKLGLPSRAQSVTKLRLGGDCYQLLMRSMRPWGCRNPSSIWILLLIPLIIDHVNWQKRYIESLAFDIWVLRREHISPTLLLCRLLGSSPSSR